MLLAAGGAEAGMAYVSNERGNSITAIDTTTLAVTQTAKVGRRPRGIIMSPDGKVIYLCASDEHAVQVIDPATLKVLRKLKSGPDPELFALHPSGNPLYIANEDDNQVTVLDVEKNRVITQVPVGTEPEGMAVSPDGKILVATSETTNMAHFIDTETYKIVANVLVDARPRFAEFTRDGTKLFVSAEVGGTVSVIDPKTRAIVRKIEFRIPGVSKETIQPVGVRVTADGKTAFVALGPANRVAVVNAETYAVEDYLLVGQRVWQLAFTPDEKLLLTTNGNSNDVSVIDVPSRKVVKSIKAGGAPWGVVAAPQ
ncbi:YVTN family beta-propeller repeat protein [Xanthobacter sp. V2C-8]